MKKMIPALLFLILVFGTTGCQYRAEKGASYLYASEIAKDVRKVLGKNYKFHKYDSSIQYDRFTPDIYHFSYDDSNGDSKVLTIYYNLNTDEILHITFAVKGSRISDHELSQVMETLFQVLSIDITPYTLQHENSMEADGYDLMYIVDDWNGWNCFFTITLTEYSIAGGLSE